MRVEIHEKVMFQSFMNQIYPEYYQVQVGGISIDSRLVQANDIFIALNGDRVDGHQFIPQAVELGASLVVSEDEVETSVPVIRVPSTHEFLIDFAQNWWKQYSMPVVGITGSNGKTTTKELLVHVLKSVMSVAWMPGNFNSTIGLPLSLFALPVSTDAAVLEMGTSAPGEINTLTNLIRPTMGVITNIHPAHIEFFSSLDHIAQEKADLLIILPSDGIAFINLDDPSIRSIQTDAKRVTYGNDDSADYIGYWQSTVNDHIFTINGREIPIPLNSETMAKNTLAVYAISHTLGLSHEDIIHQISTFTVPKGRGNIIEKNGITVIDDTYNANPESAKAGIEFALTTNQNQRHIVILGDMFELGTDTLEYHTELGKFISTKSNIFLLTYGNYSEKISDICSSCGLFSRHFTTQESINLFLKQFIRTGDIIYVKGSRGMKMETIIKGGIFS